jgi:uncharacterized protein (TIGR03067 family)
MLHLMALLCTFALPVQPTDDTKAMQGRWKIVTVLENGKTLTEQEIATHMVADGSFTVDGLVINLLPPGQFTPKAIPFVLNSTTEPKSIDLMGTTKIGSKGIYLLSGDSLMLSLPSPTQNIRPTDFGNTPGSGRVLIVLNRVRGTSTPAAAVTPTPAVTPTTLPGTTTAAAKPAITPAWTPVPAVPSTIPAVTNTMDELKKKLVGTWGHQTEEAVTYYTLNADGTFSAVVDYKEGLRNAFKEDIRSSGTWRLENGVIVVTLTTSTDKNLRGQIFSWRITNMGDRDLIAVDNQGKLRHEWKVR